MEITSFTNKKKLVIEDKYEDDIFTNNISEDEDDKEDDKKYENNYITKKSRKCVFENCNKIPSYNYINEKKAIYCVNHKLEHMIDIIHKKCVFENCNKIPSYNYINEKKAIYCVNHKLEHMIDIIHKKCKTPLCLTRENKKYDNYCLFCYIHLFPNESVSRNYKTKENSVIEYIKLKFPDFTWVKDKKIQNGCSKRRPDLLLDLGYQIIIIEIDENQHIDYDCSCENKRIMELSKDVNHRPIIFIRFNPDDYINNNIKISSCWTINKNGICVIKKSKKEEWEQRLKFLEDQIIYWINENNKTNKIIEIIQLFYDN